jgi:hypothetical protein
MFVAMGAMKTVSYFLLIFIVLLTFQTESKANPLEQSALFFELHPKVQNADQENGQDNVLDRRVFVGAVEGQMGEVVLKHLDETADNLALFSEGSADELADILRESPKAENLERKRVGFFEIAGATKAERIKSLIFIIETTAISTSVYAFYLKDKPLAAITVSSITALVNWYFGADLRRWDDLLDWADSKYQKLAGKSENIKKIISHAGPFVTTALWSVALGYVLRGTALWDQFSHEILSAKVAADIFANAGLGLFLTGTWSTLFRSWSKSIDRGEDFPMTQEELNELRRNRSLLLVFFSTMIVIGERWGFVGSSIVAATGVVLYALEHSQLKNAWRSRFDKIAKGWYKLEKSVFSIFSIFKKRKKCADALSST